MNLYLTDGGLKSAPGELVPDSIRVVADDGSDRTALAEAVESALAEAGAGKGRFGPDRRPGRREADRIAVGYLGHALDRRHRLRTAGRGSRGTRHLEHVQRPRRLPHPAVLALFRAIGASRSQVRGSSGWRRVSASESSGPCSVSASVSSSDGGALDRGPHVLDAGIRSDVAVRCGVRRRAGRRYPRHRRRGSDPRDPGLSGAPDRGTPPGRCACGRPAHPMGATDRCRSCSASAGIGLCLLGTTSQSVLFGIVGCFALFVALLVGAKVFVPPLVALFAGAVGLITRRSPAVKLAGRSASTAGVGALPRRRVLCSSESPSSRPWSSDRRACSGPSNSPLPRHHPVDLVVSTAATAVPTMRRSPPCSMIRPIVEERENVPAPTASVSVGGDRRDPAMWRSPAPRRLPAPRFCAATATTSMRARSSSTRDRWDSTRRKTDVDGQTRDRPARRAGSRSHDRDLLRRPRGDGPCQRCPMRRPSRRAPGDEVAEQTWAKIADDASSSQIEALTSELDAVGASGDAAAAQHRAEFASMFQVALSVVLGLLAAAVVIAVIGG